MINNKKKVNKEMNELNYEFITNIYNTNVLFYAK